MPFRSIYLILLVTLLVSACDHADRDPCAWGDPACRVDSNAVARCGAHIGSPGAWRLSKCTALLAKDCIDGNAREDAGDALRCPIPGT